MLRCDSPAIWQFDGFLDPDTCAAIAALAREPRWMPDPDGDAGGTDEKGYHVEVEVEADPRLIELRARLEALVGMESDVCETFRYRRYLPGQGHRPHLDCYSIEDRDLLATALIPLRDTPSGGETSFPSPPSASPPSRVASSSGTTTSPTARSTRDPATRACRSSRA